MPFDAGSVIGHFKLDSSEWGSGATKVNTHNASMTGSVFKAQLAYDLFKQALSGVVNVIKESVAEYSQHEKAVAQTEARLVSTGYAAGMTKGEIVGLSDSMMALTGIEDDTVLSAENLLLTFTKIGRDIFPQATETVLDMSVALGEDCKSAAIQLGKALQDPVLGVTALRRVGVNFNDAQKEVIKNLVETGRSAEAQAMILKELQVEFGGSARAARDTFGGALTNLNNQIGEVKEGIGRYIATAGRPFVENLGNMVKGVADFINSAEGMRQIQSVLEPLAGVFSVLFEVGKEVFGMFKGFLGKVIDDVKQAFADVVGQGNQANTVFFVLGAVMKVVSIGFTVLGKMVHGVIQYMVNLVDIAKQGWQVLKALGIAMADPLNVSKWKDVGAAVGALGEDFKKLGVNAFENIKDLVKSTIEEFAKLPQDAQVTAGAMQGYYDAATAKIRLNMEKLVRDSFYLSEVVKEDWMGASLVMQAAVAEGFVVLHNGARTMAEDSTTVKKSWLEALSDLNDAVVYAEDTYGNFSYEAGEATDAVAEHIAKLAEDTTAEWRQTTAFLLIDARAAIAKYGEYSEEAKAAATALSEHMKTKGKEAETALVTNASIVSQAFSDGFSKTAGYVSDALGRLTAIADTYWQGQLTAVDNDYNRRKKWIDENVKDTVAHDAQIVKLDKEYADKKAAIQKAQWKAQQAMAVTNVIMNTAQAIVKALADLGPVGIPVSVGFGILGAAQLATIQAQPMPDFGAEGGVFPAGRNVIVGERGPELITLGQTSRIYPTDELGRGGIQQHNYFYGDIDGEVDLDLASLKQARRLQSALRSA